MVINNIFVPVIAQALASLSDIKSPVWTYSITGGGAIAEGLSAIRQCIDIIIRTTPGTDPLRPHFGSDVYKYQDHPVHVAIPNIKKAILEAVALWEKRVTITRIQHRVGGTGEESRLYFDIGYILTDQGLNDLITVAIGNGGINTGTGAKRLILQGYFPVNPSNFQYQVRCILNGAEILPAPPVNGFSDRFSLYQWVKENWLNYGQWYLNAESIVGYMNPTYTTGTLTISLIAKNKFFGGIPVLSIGDKYVVTITVDGQQYQNSSDLFTADQVRQWAQDNVGELGAWSLETNPGSFNDDYSDDFDIYRQLLVVYTDKAENVTIEIYTESQ